MSLQPGQIIDGKYRIVRELGAGAMGAVYEGQNVRIQRRVAIKVLLPAVAGHRDTVQRFEREAQAAGRIGSDHIVEVLDLGTLPDGGLYMVMEFLEGETLGDRIRSRGRLAPREIAPLAQQLLFGLQMAHEARIIHRDLKPDNVYLVREHAGQPDFVKILDFGVSKFSPLNTDDGMSMTRTGAVVGTPFYMAPEQAKGARDIDERSDIYAVGVILYEAITGQVPFHAGTFNELIFKIVLEAPPPPESFVPDLDPAFGHLVKRAMAREPEGRFQTAAELRDALSLWLHTGTQPGQLPPSPPAGSQPDWDEKATMLVDPADRLERAPTSIRPPVEQGAAAGPAAHGPPAVPGPYYYPEEPAWPVAGLPAPIMREGAGRRVGLVVGAVALCAVGGVAAAVLLGPDAGEPSPDGAAKAAAAPALDTAEPDDEPADPPQAAASSSQSAAEPTAEPTSGPPPDERAAARPNPPAKPAAATDKPPAPKPSAAAPPPKNKPPAGGKGKPGRSIATEL